MLFAVDSLLALHPLTVLAAAGFAGGIYLFVRGFRLLARKRLLINTSTSKIRSVSLGLVEVNGVATGPYTVPTPITGTPCFLYRTTAWQKGDESRTGEWRKVAEESLHVPFFLDDNTGQLLIQPKDAELDLHPDTRQDYSDTMFSPHATPSVLSFLARHGVEPSNKIRIEECSIRPNSPLFIVGTLAENPGIEVRPFAADRFATNRQGGFARAGIGLPPMTPPAEIVRLSQPSTDSPPGNMSQQSKIAAALTKAGIAHSATWDDAGTPYRNATLTPGPLIQEISVNEDGATPKPHNVPAFDLTPPVVLMKGEKNAAFLISWHSQHDVVRALSWKSAAMIWCGAGLTLLGIYILFQQ